MGFSSSGLLSSLIHAISVFVCFISAYISRLRMLGKDKDMILVAQEREEEGEKTELNFKFRFPPFEQNLFNSETKNRKVEFASGKKGPVSAFIEVLKTLPVDDDKIVSFSCNNESENVKIEEIELQENKVEEEFLDFLNDGDFREDLGVNGEVNKVKEKQNPVILSSDFLSENDFNGDSDKKNDTGFVAKYGKESATMDSNKLESLWEHQDLIEQLQMELKKAKATGLPTILEESESPKMIDGLKPWKIEDKTSREDYMGELHKFYKSYSEMMRKFDIFNYQKMYVMGFMPPNSTSQQKPRLKSLVSRTLSKHKSRGNDPIKNFEDELQGDLEVVYVGQTCLSWEFLHWQYEKALDLWNSDPNGIHSYNEVAGEFQQFQVLVQRFTENEPFHGPRVQSYVKSRCVLRNLLQVPVIREDVLEEENKGSMRKEADEHVITSEMLVEIVEESVGIFWQFVRTEKDCSTLSGRKKMPDPEDQKLMQEVRKTLQKSEKKLKDILRSEKCILRKFRESREEDESDQALQFFAQVDIKLVNRVLNMSKISKDQLIWCQNKLSKISFLNRKIYREPAFFLFPS